MWVHGSASCDPTPLAPMHNPCEKNISPHPVLERQESNHGSKGLTASPIVTLTVPPPARLPRILARRRLPLCMRSPPHTPSILPAPLLCRSPCDPHHIGVCICVPDPARPHLDPFTGDEDLRQQKLGGRPHVPPPDPARSTTRCSNPFSFCPAI